MPPNIGHTLTQNWENADPHRDAYTVQEAAARLGGLSHRTVLDLISEGRLQAVRAGKRYIIGKRDIHNFLYPPVESGSQAL